MRRKAHSRRARSAGRESSSHPEPKLGQKLSILFRITGDPQHPLNEAVGILQRVVDDEERGRVYYVVKRDGTLVEVPRNDIVNLKIVPTR